ncbi:hypothetical protein ACFX2J_046891 [Malus domestica]
MGSSEGIKRLSPLVSLVMPSRERALFLTSFSDFKWHLHIAHVQKGYGVGMHHLRELHWMRLNTIYHYWIMMLLIGQKQDNGRITPCEYQELALKPVEDKKKI